MKSKAKRSIPRNNVIAQNVKNTPVVQTEPVEEVILQFGENEVPVSAISDKVKQDIEQQGNEVDIKDIKIYVKPEDNKAYYVINGEITGNVNLI